MMLSRRLCNVLIAAMVLCSLPLAAQTEPTLTLQQLRENFLHPSDSAKPMVRWWWFGAAVTKPEILHELQQMKADGIGGAELAFVYPEVLDGLNPGGVGTGNGTNNFKNLPFLSPEMLDAVHYAETEGHRLGLRIDVTLCSGWPYGGPNTPLNEAAGRLRTVEVPIAAGQEYDWEFPALEPGESPITMAVVKGVPKHWDASTAFMPSNLATGVQAGPYKEPHVALYFIASHTLQQVKRAAVGAEGYVLDPFSHQAVATHLAKVGEPLVKAFGSTPPYAIFSDSLEAYGADWTPDLPQQFLKRRGYDLIPHLPELVAGGTPEAEKVRHDWGRTLTELVNENYLTQINDWAKAHGTKFRSQTYGEPAVSFSSQRLAALPEGEGPQWRAFSTLRWATSANHVFGNNVTSGETFTWLHSPVFRATPLDMKAEADIDFIMGENQLIFHGWPYSPPPSELVPGDPGWSLYAAAVFNDHNPWHPVMPAVTQYIARISWLLRQGEPANQVALLLPTDDAWASFTPGHVTVTGALQKLVRPELMSAILSAGYNVDFIDAETINRQGLGDHQILVLPPTDRIPVETLQRIADWRKQQYAISAKREYDVICYQRCPSIDPEGKPLPGMTGSFLIADSADALTKAMHEAVKPDLQLGAPDSNVGFIHRKLANADIYFVTNTGNQPVRTTARLGTEYAGGEVLDPESGRHTDSIDSQAVQLDLAPYASEAFLFDQQQAPVPKPKVPGGKSIEAIVNGWKVTFPSLQRSMPISLPHDWTQYPATRNYSGEVVYERDAPMRSGIKTSHSRLFLEVTGGTALPGAPNTGPEEHLTRGPDGLPNPLITGTGPGMHAYFDPPIREAALVFINGRPAGALWHPPYRLDLTKLLKPGTNHIEIRVYNTALNAWSALPPRDYKPLIEKYGDRFQMQDLDKVKPIPSGILGTIKLVTETP